MPIDPSRYRLCLVTDREIGHGRPLVEVVMRAVAGGVTMVQLREKTAPTRAILEEARALKAALAGHGVPLVVNDRADIAVAIGADGVHVGQTDLPVEAVRAVVGPGMAIGLSITDAEQIARADAGAADYLGIGPVHPQKTKADASAPLGLGGFARLRRMTGKPVLAIGGVKADDVPMLVEEGATGVAVVSAIMGAQDPEAAARLFAAAWASETR
ncbi:thiamine phosphate synthase [Lichenibacterium minor]|jgi:thiamine-phosphate pyrophosphorylase|uniref:Thiamine-phosphate synthase n=1 Tax=Lichenibacterium minor TaxID=2316528 RepID=A0A4Q2U5Z9_9HYPH|nr:thiamine phosphate synthase [Lichenibacterium minor]RYC31852.1 thiamine phosphate synthase [Lichenibacterium minor]